MNKFLSIGFMILSTRAMAIDYPSMDEFFADPTNQKKLEKIKISDMREAYSKGCLYEAKTDIDKKQCECTSEFVNTIDSKEMFYESYMAYKLFMDLVQSKKDGDLAKESEIKTFKEQRDGLEKKLELACPKSNQESIR